METATKAPSLTSVAHPHVDFHLDEWEKEKQSCPVCKAYISSPCRLEFKDMAMCADRVNAEKKDIDMCTEKLLPLLACEKRNLNYFKSHAHLASEFESSD